MLRLEMLPNQRWFSPAAAGDRLFEAFNPAAWNKLFRTDFVRAHGLEFQELRRTNDAYFTYMSLALARRIACLDRHLINYRVANSSSLQATIHQDPLEFVRALEAMRSTLKDVGLWDRMERAFSQLALSLCVGNLKRQSTAESFLEVYEALRGGVLDRLGILDRPDGYFLRADHREWHRRVLTETPEEYLFQRATSAERSVEKAGFEARAAMREAAARTGRSTRTGRSEPVAARDEDPGDAARPDVSVIIPVHNTLVYLVECIESVQRQTGCDVEIICIDDGSTDGSGEVLDRYAEAEPRMRILRQHNGGIARARNAGLSRASGRYVCFLDSDDYWEDDVLSELVRRADADDLDALLYDARSVREPGVADRTWSKYRNYYERRAYEGVFEGPRLMAAMHDVKEYRASACLYLARRRYLTERGLSFFPGITHEDNLFTFALLLDARRVGHSRLAFYGRRVRPNSIVTTGSRASAAHGYFVTWIEMLRLLRDRDLGDAEVSLAVGAIVQGVFSSARRNTSPLPTEVIDWLADVDTGADAAALFWALRRSWTDDKEKKRLERRLKDSAPPSGSPKAPDPIKPVKASFGRRVKRRLRRLLRGR
jgi:glycosyltransferase involved in cell wall biosynthesis